MADDQAADDHTTEPSPKQTRKVDVRRFLIVAAVVLAAIAYVLWDDVRDIIKPPEIVPPTIPSDALLSDSQVKVKSGQLDITFTKVGAAITHMTWTNPDDGHTETLISQDEVPNHALVVELPGSEKWADREFSLVGPTVSNDVTQLRFTAESPDGRTALVKTFTIHSDKPLIRLDIRIKAKWMGDKGYRLKISNAVGLPSELGKDDCLISVRANRITDHHRVRRLSGAETWPTEK